MNPGADEDPSAVDVPVFEERKLLRAARYVTDGEGGAIVQALAEAMMEEMSQEELIPFDANLAEYLDESDIWDSCHRVARLRMRMT
jgi:hypothetical protein